MNEYIVSNGYLIVRTATHYYYAKPNAQNERLTFHQTFLGAIEMFVTERDYNIIIIISVARFDEKTRPFGPIAVFAGYNSRDSYDERPKRRQFVAIKRERKLFVSNFTRSVC